MTNFFLQILIFFHRLVNFGAHAGNLNLLLVKKKQNYYLRKIPDYFAIQVKCNCWVFKWTGIQVQTVHNSPVFKSWWPSCRCRTYRVSYTQTTITMWQPCSTFIAGNPASHQTFLVNINNGAKQSSQFNYKYVCTQINPTYLKGY